MAASGPSSTDVAIIGGGIVGTALAADLAGRGARLTLLERAEVAAGASGRNSGVVWYPADPILGALYRETLARYRSLADEVTTELPATAAERSFRLGDEPAGILLLGTDEAWLQGRAAAIGAANPEFRPSFVDAVALRRLEPALADDLAAVRLDIGFPVAPSAATHAFAALARARGADVRVAATASVLRAGGRAIGVSTAGGPIAAGAVVVTAGPWSPEVIDPSGAWRPILPFWGVIVELELDAPPSHVLEEADIDAAIDPEAPPPGETDEPTGFSLVSLDGRAALGSTFLPVQPDPRAFEDRLRAKGARYLPAIADAPTRGLRACARPLALDGRPLVGAVPGVEGLFVAAGHGPWGISTGPASAAHVAALALGEPDPREPAVRAATDAGRLGAPPAAAAADAARR
jgi:glycine/D-amino acid oxidase-like deaminating enzyme